MLQHRFNRGDIIVTGLLNNLDGIKEVTNKLRTHLKVELVKGDILNTKYIKKHKAILIRFGHIITRDNLMTEYLIKNLKVADIVGGSGETRVYLNDNYKSLANKLLKICWKLKNDKKIKSYSIINREILRDNITILNEDVIIFL